MATLGFHTNEHFATTLMPLMMNETDVDVMNKTICDEVYKYFTLPIQTPQDPGPQIQSKKHPRHNRELKCLTSKES
jgi:hypothetical protein